MTWFLAAVAALIAYPIGLGPMYYLRFRILLPRRLYGLYVAPLRVALKGTRPGRGLERYVRWWGRLAFRHDAPRRRRTGMI